MSICAPARERLPDPSTSGGETCPVTAELPSGTAAAPSGDLDRFVDTRGSLGRVVDWLRRNLFSSPSNTVLTLLVLALLWVVLPPFLDWMIFDATISGDSKAACTGGLAVAGDRRIEEIGRAHV